MWWPFWVLIAILLLLIGLFACVVLMLYKGKKEALPSAVSALSDLGDGIQVKQISHGYVFLPNKPRLGLVYVPGALVDSRAYAPLCRDIAKQSGCAVVLLDFPMRLAYLGPSRIAKAISDVHTLQGISRWALGGHSLGGAVAIKVLLDQQRKTNAPDALQSTLFQQEYVGIALHGSYNNMRYTKGPVPDSIPVLQVLAQNDGITSSEDLEKFKLGLPQGNTAIVDIDGGNHASFGQYGPLPHTLRGRVDGTCTIGSEKQHQIVVDATTEWLRRIE